MLEMDQRLRPVRRQVLAVLGAAFVLSSSWIGWWPLAPLAAVAILFEIGDLLAPRAARPEFVKFGIWTGSQTVIAASLIVLGEMGAICFLAVPMPTLASRFSHRGIIAGAIFSLLLLLATAFAIDAGAVVQEPEAVLASAAVIGSIAWFMKGGVMSDGLEIRRTSLVDPLTQLLNRAALEAQAREMQSDSASEAVGLIAVDVDGFKAINDRFGHQVGDAVLREVAERLRRGLRSSDLVFRSGGEEFILLLPGSNEQDTEGVAQASKSPLAAEWRQQVRGISITIRWFGRLTKRSTELRGPVATA
jgi:diguanylate cyclase (GGDEF)-like protein